MRRIHLSWPRWRPLEKLRCLWQGWVESLGVARQELIELNEATERDFLAVGARLQVFLDTARQISDQCSLLVGFLTGEEAERGASDLRSILDRARSMSDQVETNRLALDRMLTGVAQVTESLAGLNQNMRNFRVMATLIRIESARLHEPGVDFDSLAEDVRKLAADIEERSGVILTASRELGDIVRQAMVGVDQFESRQKAELPRIAAQAGARLEALREQRQRASGASRDMASGCDAVWREIGDLVTLLQFHDITHQQVEHVVEALGEPAPEFSEQAVASLVWICRLQRAQLGHTKESFVTTVERVREGLAGISRHASTMAAESIDVLKGAAGSGDSFLGEMEQGFAGIRTALAAYGESRYALATVADTVAEEARNMTGFVEKIEEIGIRMQRIAINANVKSIRIGSQGIALGAVADGIQRIAVESTERTAVAAEGIREVAAGSERLSAELAASDADLATELEDVNGAFHAADTETRTRLAEISDLVRSLAQELETIASGIEADKVVADGIERSCRRLEQIEAVAGGFVSSDDDAGRTEALRKLEDRYTMHAERTVHQQASSDGAVPVAATVEEWGDNVELF